MYKNWIRFGSFSLIFIFLFAWLNKAYSIEVPAWRDFYKIPRNSIDIIFFGNSHAISTFQPQIINDLLDINSYLLGVPGEKIQLSYFELREMLKYQKPKLIVLESFPMNFTDLVFPAIIFNFTDSGFWNGNKLNVLARNLNKDNLYTAFPVLHQGIDWNNPSDFGQKLISMPSKFNGSIDPALGYVSVPMMITPEEVDAAIQAQEADSKTSLEKNLQYLDQFIQLCEKEKISLLFTTIPPIKIFGETFKYYVPFDAEKYSMEHQIDYLKFDVSQLNELHRFDPGHLNDFGSVSVSIQAAQAISSRLGIPIDQDQLDYYNTFLFSGYSLVNNGEEYTFSLLTKDVNAPLEYQFEVSINSSNEVIASTNWQSNNEITFNLTEPVAHTLKVKVRNLNGDFSVSGNLTIINHH